MTTVKTFVWQSPEQLQLINENPRIASLLYDLGLLPEEISARIRGYVEAERKRWLDIVAMFERVVAAHPCANEHCSCREIRAQIAAHASGEKQG